MSFDYKKEFKEFYQPKNKPQLMTIPAMNYIAVKGKGNPNDSDGEYKQAMGWLYGIAFTLKMSHKASYTIPGYFDYVVPPLEGLWWMDDYEIPNYQHKEKFQWISMIRVPDFICKVDFDWAIQEATKKKKADFSKVMLFHYDEGSCVQCMHIGSYDSEPITIEAMDHYAKEMGYTLDINEHRFHHEIYLSDPRKGKVDKQKTVLRHPIKKIEY